MNILGSGTKKKTEENKRSSDISAEAWSSMASGGNDASVGGRGRGGDDDDGFLNPESNLPSNRSLKESDWTRERSAQQLELSSVHDPRASSSGLCSRAFECTVMGLHVVDFACGFASVTYGSLLVSKFAEPAMAAALFCLILGVVHLASSSAGIFSYFVRGCRRYGLALSGFVGPYVAFVYLTMAVSLLADGSGFLRYLDENKHLLYMGPNVVAKCQSLMPLFYTVLIVLGTLEAMRFPVAVRTRERLRRRDEDEALIPAPSVYERQGDAGNEALTAALLEGGGGGGDDAASARSGGGGAVSRESTGTPNWWDGEGG